MARIGAVVAGVGVAGVGLGVGALEWIKVRQDRRIEAVWQQLASSPTSGAVFSEDMMDDLPEPARRYFLHAIQPSASTAMPGG